MEDGEIGVFCRGRGEGRWWILDESEIAPGILGGALEDFGGGR